MTKFKHRNQIFENAVKLICLSGRSYVSTSHWRFLLFISDLEFLLLGVKSYLGFSMKSNLKLRLKKYLLKLITTYFISYNINN